MNNMNKRFLIRGLAVCISLLSLFAGCQPTPEKPAIVNKNDGKLEEKMQETPAPLKPYEAPAHWSETAEGEKLDIVIDADITLPNVSAYPVVKLEPMNYTQEQIDAMAYYFAGDVKYYLPPVKTKADYDEEIIEAKRPPDIDEDYVIEGWDPSEWVKELEEEREAAPDDAPIIYCDTTLTYNRRSDTGEEFKAYGKNYLSVCFENKDGDEGTIVANNCIKEGNIVMAPSFSYSSSDAQLVSESMYRYAIDGGESEEECGWVGAGALFDKVTVYEDDAKLKAQQVLGDLNIKDLMLVSCEKAVSPNVPERGGYEITFQRQSGGIAAYSLGGGSYSEGEVPPAYSPPFGEEILRIDISQFGVEAFSWWGYAHEVEKVSDNVSLLPFDEIKQRLRKQIFYKKSFSSGIDMTDNDTVTVISAELRMGYIGVKENLNQALMVPIWVFETTYSCDDKRYGTHDSYPDNTYILNAIDGGVIEAARF